jgi:hypothetical protein
MIYINLEYLKIISNGDTEFLLRTINSLIEELHETTTKMQIHALNADLNGIHAQIHGIKPNLHLIGNKTLIDSFKIIETFSSSMVHVKTLPFLIKEIYDLSEEIISELEKEKQVLEYNFQKEQKK